MGVVADIKFKHRQPKLILRNLQNVGHYQTLYWGFAHFLKIIIVEIKFTYLQFTLYLCVVRSKIFMECFSDGCKRNEALQNMSHKNIY